jgi:hypothetical protein
MKPPQQFPEYIDDYDLNKAAHHFHCGLNCEVVADYTGRVSFRFPASPKYFDLSARWGRNEPIPCVDFANQIRILRARMLASKTEKGQNNGINQNIR